MTYYETDLKYAVTMPSHREYCTNHKFSSHVFELKWIQPYSWICMILTSQQVCYSRRVCVYVCFCVWRRGGGRLGSWNIVEWMSHFPILEELFWNFISFPVPQTKLGLFEWYWGVSLQAGKFGTLKYSRIKVPFPNSKKSSVFQFQRLIRCFLVDIEVCHFCLGVLAPWVIVKCEYLFSVFRELFFILVNF